MSTDAADTMAIELDRAMRATRGRIETTVGRLCDEFGLSPECVAIVLDKMSRDTVRHADGAVSKQYDLRHPWIPATAHRSQAVVLQMGGWYFDEVSR